MAKKSGQMATFKSQKWAEKSLRFDVKLGKKG